jgi:cytochrome P450 family 135
MTEQDLRDELVTLLTDGPTSSLLSWSFERILRHPAQYARLQAEIDRDEEDIYFDAVVKEVMRLCPAAPIVVRRLLEPTELGVTRSPPGRPLRRVCISCTDGPTSTLNRSAFARSASCSGQRVPTR